jgi:hypothetical protein
VPATLHRILPATALCLLLLCVLLVSPASSSPPVDVEVAVALASNGPPSVDPDLAPLAPKLKQMFKYTTYRLIDRQRKSVGDDTADFPLPGGKVLKASHTPSKDGKIRLAVQVIDGSRNLLTTTLAMNKGGMVLLGGPAYQDGVLILVLSSP